MKILVIGNLSDGPCGFKQFTEQTVIALGGHRLSITGQPFTDAVPEYGLHQVTAFDGTYSVVYQRQQDALPDSFLPPDAASYDVIHVIWHPATMNHYSGATWPVGPVLSVWNGCPAAWCPFNDSMHVKWGVLGREEGHRQLWYPIPDWVWPLRHHPTSPKFTVGWSGIRGDGLEGLQEVCRTHKWETNFSVKGEWLPLTEEIRRLAKSTVNVCWYSPVNDDRSGAAMVCLASCRPFVANQVPMMTHVLPYAPKEIYTGEDLETTLLQVERDWQEGELRYPASILKDYGWAHAVTKLEEGWKDVAATF